LREVKRVVDLLSVLLLVLPLGCSAELPGKNELFLKIGNAGIWRRATERLQQEHIWYRTVPGDNLVIKKNSSDVERATKIISELFEEFLPAGRNASFNSDLASRVTEEFRKQNIPFREVRLGDDVFVVWEDGYEERAGDIVEEVIQEYVSSKERASKKTLTIQHSVPK